MDQISYTLAAARPEDRPEIEALHELVFGSGRFARTAYRVRESAAPDAGFSLVALRQGRLIGSVLLTEVLIGDAPALLLGPLAVHPDFQKNGCGSALLDAAVDAAHAHGDALIVLVGDEPYYARTGFRRVPDGRIEWPGPVDPARVLALELVPGALDHAHGPIGSRNASPTKLKGSAPSTCPAGRRQKGRMVLRAEPEWISPCEVTLPHFAWIRRRAERADEAGRSCLDHTSAA